MPRQGYGQFCPVAIASEVLAERWMPLVLRELLCGSHRFNDLHRGVPLMSATLLSQRLKELEMAGLVERREQEGGRGHEYHLTEAGDALRPIIEGFGVWGLRYLRSMFDPSNLDPGLLLWDMRRSIRPEHLPRGRVVIRIDLTDTAPAKRHWWLVKDQNELDLDLCLQDPGFDVDLTVTTDMETMARVWLGDVGVESAVRTGRLKLDGPPALRLSFYDWIGLSLFAHLRDAGVEGVPPAAVIAAT
jgi:DNA-binding HxlR family transcriptional regulator